MPFEKNKTAVSGKKLFYEKTNRNPQSAPRFWLSAAMRRKSLWLSASALLAGALTLALLWFPHGGGTKAVVAKISDSAYKTPPQKPTLAQPFQKPQKETRLKPVVPQKRNKPHPPPKKVKEEIADSTQETDTTNTGSEFLNKNTEKAQPDTFVVLPDKDTLRVCFDLAKATKEPLQVKELNLQNTGLNQIPPEVFRCKNLYVLRLDGNNISEIPDSIKKLKLLTTISLSENNLQTFPKALLYVPTLKKIDLSKNGLRRIPRKIKKLDKLEEIILWGNNFSRFPPAMLFLPGLKEIDLSMNPLRRVSPRIKKLDKLHHLDLDETRLSPQKQEKLKERLPQTEVIF